MSKKVFKYSALVASLLMTAVFAGCGTSHKEGALNLDSIGNVGDTACIQCHSAVQDELTGESIITQYEATSPHKDSAHANNGNGCEACHGGGAQHNGVGPIPYVNPYDGNGTRCATCHKGVYATNAPTAFADSKHANVEVEEGGSCRRCHSHEGAVLGALYGLTGTKALMDNTSYQGAVPLAKEYTQFQCATCHVHGAGLRTVKTRDASGNLVNWNPSKTNKINDQFNLCTSCHGLKDNDGTTVLGSSTKAATATMPAMNPVGHHETSWYRVIGTTHFNNLDNPTAGGISGYVIRTKGETPCFDCHAHEAKTNTRTANDPANDTIYTEWAKSGHAGGLLQKKYDAAGTTANSVALVDTVMNATTSNPAWTEDDWSATGQQACQRCHTATGASNFLNGPAAYDPTKNDFSHLYNAANSKSWSTTTPASTQREVLYCWGCHKNSGAGVLRTPGAITATYKRNGATVTFPDTGASSVCIACHIGRAGGDDIVALTTANNTFTNVGFKNSHYMAAAGLMYVKIGYTNFVPAQTAIGASTTSYGQSLTSDADMTVDVNGAAVAGKVTSTHRKLGTAAIVGDHGITADMNLSSNGPCATCHYAAGDHSLELGQKALDNVCSKCHDVTTTADLEAFIDEEGAAPFQDALRLAVKELKDNFAITYDSSAYPYFFDDKLGTDHTSANQVKDWTRGTLTAAKAENLMGACFNINVLTREPAAYAHARTYARRLLYDSIDFLDDKTINLSVSATALASGLVDGSSNPIYVKGTTAAAADGTTESMKYLLGYNRTSNVWNTPERP
ncbi:MAG: cytochrome C [Geobacter sp.]|nr:MAG: cytochrome C [Geobacter sp.]